MGNVKDRYFKYADNGDQFVGRCLCLLPILTVDLAVSPPYFTNAADMNWVNNMTKAQFYHLYLIPDFGLLLKMCLATMLHWHHLITDYLHFNHVVQDSSVVFNNTADIEHIENKKLVCISYPWSHPNLVFQINKELQNYCQQKSNKVKVQNY
jgi:hypothetical protein